MGKFLKIVFGSCLGVILALLAIGLIVSAIAGAGFKSLEGKEVKIEANSVLHLDIDGFVPEKTNNVETDPFDYKNSKTYGIFDIIKGIESAKSDKKIKGIFLSNKNSGLDKVKSELLAEALLDFKESGKFVYSYGDFYSSSSYYLASVSDRIIMHPLGVIDLRGFGTTQEYFPRMLQALNIEPEIYYAGKFKSATEPLRRTSMSEENRKQTKAILMDLRKNFVEQIAENRGQTSEDIIAAMNNFSGRDVELALESGLIDEIGYGTDMTEIIKRDLDLDKKEDITFVEVSDYLDQSKDKKDYKVDNKIAILYAEGEINMGADQNGMITEKTYVKAIRDIRKEDKIKAIVLRVNSPGGSALVSDKIWHELKICQDEGKPVVVSMGQYAASGGYYIASASDSIFAEPNTITGSIGVFGVMFNFRKMMNNKLRIDFDTLEIDRYATDFNGIDDRSADEAAIIQQSVDRTYDIFLNVVAENRGMTKEEVNEIAQGRVWTADMALQNGLIDKIGGLDDAVAAASSLAELDKYRITEYPKLKTSFEKLIEDFSTMTDTESKVSQIKSEIAKELPVAGDLMKLQSLSGEPQALMSWELSWE